MRFDQALAAVVARLGPAYGYTLTVWGSGALLMHVRGQPKPLDVFLFVMTASAAFVICALASAHQRSDRVSLPSTALWENVCALPALLVSYGAVLAVGPRAASYALAPAAGSLAYFLMLALLARLVAR